jgi:hypothetical protein
MTSDEEAEELNHGGQLAYLGGPNGSLKSNVQWGTNKGLE